MGGKAPKAPDPYKTADAQGKLNRETAEYQAALNRSNQSTPFGSISWAQTGTDPTTGAARWGSSTTLTPELQNLLNSQISSQQGLSSAITGALGDLPQGPFDASGINVDDVRDRSFQSQMANLTPEFEKGWRNLEGTLSDRGIPLGAEIWNNQLGEYNRAKDSSMLGASRQADLDASNEFQRQYGNKLTEYNLPLQKLQGLLGSSQAVGNPQFGSTPQSSVAAPDLQSGVWNKYAADQQAYQQNQGNMMGGLLGLGKLGLSAASMFSDRRVKDDIAEVGRLNDGQRVYRYRYKNSPQWQIGLMAQEVQEHAPEAVGEVGGVLTVNYDVATRRAKRMAA